MKLLLITKCGCSKLINMDFPVQQPPLYYEVALIDRLLPVYPPTMDFEEQSTYNMRRFSLRGTIHVDGAGGNIFEYREV